MIAINDERIQKYLTPYRYPEPILQGSGEKGAFDEKAVDIPFVFWHGGRFHMLYTGFDGQGYQSALAVSDDLIHWTHKGVILKRDLDSGRWDRVGGAAPAHGEGHAVQRGDRRGPPPAKQRAAQAGQLPV